MKNALGRIGPAWRGGLLVFVFGRALYSLWALALLAFFPLAVQNTQLGGEPVLTVFDLTHNRGFVFSRQVNSQVLTFRANGSAELVDLQFGSRWDIRSGQALSGSLQGTRLSPAGYSTEDVFPYRGADTESSGWLGVWQRFDTNWYLKVAESGYTSTDGSTAFFPLYPWLIRLLAFLVRDDLLAALLLSNASLLGALVLVYKVAEGLFEPEAIRRGLIYLVLFPTSFFFFAGYTEALFLLLALASLLAARKGRWPLAGLLGGLAGLTRLQGFLMLAPLLVLWWEQKPPRRISQAAWLALVPLATAGFFLATGGGMAGSLQTIWRSQLVWPWQNIWMALVQLASGSGSIMDGLNLAVIVLFAVLSGLAWKRLPHAWTVYMLAMLLIPLFRANAGQPLVSLSRYCLAIFPAFLLLGRWGKNPWINRLILYAGLLAALYFCAQFLSWGWVA